MTHLPAAAARLSPAAQAALDRTIATLRRRAPRCCAHAGDPTWLICAAHPSAGMLCGACLRRHLNGDGHDDAFEHTCDRCGDQVDEIGGVLAKLPRPKLVQPPRSAAVPNGKPVHAVGLGLCHPCADAVERMRTRATPGRALFVLPEVAEAMPAELRNAVALRNQASVEGRCPSCGAAVVLGELRPGLTEARMEHEDDCPVTLTVAK